MTDQIAYLLLTQPGGVDGMDRSDNGGVIVAASFDKEAIEKRKGLDSRYKIEPRVVNDADKRRALAKLDRLDRLLLGLSD